MAIKTLLALSFCAVCGAIKCAYANQESQKPTENDACASPSAAQQFTLDKIHIDPQPIFDESAPDSIALHRWANRLHVVTKPFVIQERLPFDEGDVVTTKDIVEAEAILRRERYIANAELDLKVTCQEVEPDSTNSQDSRKNTNLKVTTYDNWSLIPTFSFSRSGSENRTILGVREDNFLGLGVRTQVRYTSDEQRDGYQVSFASAVPGVRHANALISLADNDDGERYQFVFSKPFYHLTSERMVHAEFFQNTRVEDIFQNDETRNSLAIDSEFYSFATGWNLSLSGGSSRRLILGYTQDKDQFAIDLSSPSSAETFLPDQRDFRYPWIAYEFAQRDIRVMEDIYLINQPEDINFGWHYRVQLGLEVKDVKADRNFGYQLRLNAAKAWSLADGIVVSRVSGIASLNTKSKDFIRADMTNEYFYRASDLLGWYSRLSATFSTGNFLDNPIVIDDDSGVRGYANQYQHGEHKISASIEARFYTDYNFYQLFDVGFAAFADVGRAFGGEFSSLNEDDGVLSSVGIGARFYSDKASDKSVIHLDFSRPLSNGENVNSWEWSIQARRGF